MAKRCFCGCGRKVRFSRRTSNWQGEQLERLIAIFAGVLEQGDDPEHATELTELVQRGGQLRDLARDFAHGQIDIEQSDYRGRGEWIDAALVHELRLARRVAEAGYAGLDAIEQTYLIYAGQAAPATIVAIADTGVTINQDPRVKLRLRVEPSDGPQFEVERKLVVAASDSP